MQKKQLTTAMRKIKHKTDNNFEILIEDPQFTKINLTDRSQQGKHSKIQANAYIVEKQKSSLSVYETKRMPNMVVPLFEEIITNERQYQKHNNHTNNPNKYDMSKIIQKTEILQQHPKYALMQQYNEKLMANELLALIYYLDP
eukprot:523486_1